MVSEKELEKLIRDAKRYRFWRNNHSIISPEQCDLLIDDLMHKKGEYDTRVPNPGL